MGNMFAAPIDSLMPAYFLQGKYIDSAYSIFMVGIALGGIIGGVGLAKIQRKFTNNKLLAFGFVSIMNATILQLETPKDMLARTFSIFKCISYIAGPAGIILAGFLGETIEMRIVFVPFGLFLFVTSLLTMVLISPKMISK